MFESTLDSELLISSWVIETSFNVLSYFSQLKVFRCALHCDIGILFIYGE